MNKKFLTMLFGLLLAVGWTSSVSAQALPQGGYAERLGLMQFERRADGKVPLSMLKGHQPQLKAVQQKTGGEITRLNAPKRKPKAKTIVNNDNGQGTKLNAPMRAPVATLSKDQASLLKYDWRNPNTGEHGEQVPATEVAKDPYQIYQLLKFVYKTPAFPGPYTNAYTSSGQPEDPVYYGGIAGGWNIDFEPSPSTQASTTTYDDINITFGNNYSYTLIESITVSSGSTTITSWSYANNSNYLPSEWDFGGTISLDTYSGTTYIASEDGTGYFTIPGSMLEGYSSVTVTIRARSTSSSYYAYVYVNNEYQRTYSTSGTNLYWYPSGTTVNYTDYETTPTDVLITLGNSHLFVNSIEVLDARTNRSITSWVASTASLPTGWYASNTLAATSTTFDGYPYRNMDGGGTIRIPASLFANSDSIKVQMVAVGDSDDEMAKLYLCRSDRFYYLYNEDGAALLAQTIKFPKVIPSETYKPTEGYTALIVAVKNDAQKFSGETFESAFEFTDSTSVINYIANTVDSVKLLTDGMRIGEGEGIGTVFNCDGTYNKFFFLGKGRARKKTSGVYSSIGLSSQPWPSYACEEGPFKYMFEQFSPTTGVRGDQIEDFYSEMMDGHVYKVVHDCASVIQEGHQFSLTGNSGTGSFAFKGMNFFIPDYRLKYWLGTDSIGVGEPDDDGHYASYTYFDCDGRDMNPYMVANSTGYTGVANQSASTWAVNYAQYNPEIAPKVGIYLLALEATAKPSAGYDPEDPNSRYFDITLTWVSSLDEMTNAPVPQVFTIYYIGDDGERHLLDELVVGITNPTNELTLTYPWPQEATSQTFTYVVEGRGTGQYSPFVAWTNEDEVIIPGYDDFLALDVDHIESDFVIDEQRNYYRNFLTVTSENDLNGLSYEDIQNAPNGQMSFDIYRSVTKPEPQVQTEKKIATLTFYDATANTVKYRIEYVEDEEQQRLDYTLNTKENGQPITIADAYSLVNMGIDTQGELRVRGNGDLVIQPNGYHVNFKSITVKSGNNVIASWTTEDGDIVDENDPNCLWKLSPGSMWVRHLTDLGEVTYYLEGGGYLYLENILNQYSPLTVEIEAFGDGTTIARVLVNDKSERFKNNTPETITWTVRASNNNGGGSKAPINKSNN